jgi:hypothetical protein
MFEETALLIEAQLDWMKGVRLFEGGNANLNDEPCTIHTGLALKPGSVHHAGEII